MNVFFAKIRPSRCGKFTLKYFSVFKKKKNPDHMALDFLILVHHLLRIH